MIGKTISHYKIIERLGEGGMGVVYKAQDIKLDRYVALKFLPPHLTGNEDAKKRFIQEAKAASALDHPNICSIYEIGETPDDQLFIAMAYYGGATLRSRLVSGPLGTNESVEVVKQMAAGLGKAHENRIIHRDVKPGNVMITQDGQAKILDFGVAKLAGGTKVTRTGSTVGTVAYMSPEQARGEDVDARSDVFSTGVVLYELLTGQLPFQGDHEAAVLYEILNVEPPPMERINPNVPDSLQRIVDKALEKNRNKRYAGMSELLQDLTAAGSTPAQLPASNRRRLRFRSRIMLAAAVAVVIILFGHAVFDWFMGRFEKVGRPGAEREFVIAVAPFWGINDKAMEEGAVMQRLIVRHLTMVLEGEGDARVIGSEGAGTPRTVDDAMILGSKLKSSIVLWGEVLMLRDEVEIQPYMTLMPAAGLRGARASPRKSNEERALLVNLNEPDQIELRKTKAGEVGDAVLLSAARFYRKGNPSKALAMLDRISPPSSESMRLRGMIMADDEANTTWRLRNTGMQWRSIRKTHTLTFTQDYYTQISSGPMK
ncbi:MAG: serine/threonine protein kinase [Chitinivibrionia bacterium]|nr:serine/threonine protein kinase [Chitinivibrionia bacterium]